MKALSTEIQINEEIVTGLLLPDNTYGFKVYDLHRITEIGEKHCSDICKAVLGKENLRSTKTVKSNRSINYISLKELAVVLSHRVVNEDEKASAVLKYFPLSDLWDTAFDRNTKLVPTQKDIHHKIYNKAIVKWALKDTKSGGVETMFRCFRLAIGLPNKKIKNYSEDQMYRLTTAEIIYSTARECGMNHFKALDIVKVQLKRMFGGLNYE